MSSRELSSGDVRPLHRRRLLAASLMMLAPACGEPPRTARPPARRKLTAADVLPADLDVVLRVDVGRLGATLGAEQLTKLAENEDGPDRALLAVLLPRARAVWVALRPAAKRELIDRVLVLEGDFDLDFERTPGFAGWSAPIDLGAGQFMHERVAQRRDRYTRLYRQLPDLVVFGTDAERDALAARIERLEPGTPLAPPARGVLSFALRPSGLGPLLAELPRSARQLLGPLEQLTGWGDLEAGQATITLEGRCADDKTAELVAVALGEVRAAFAEGSPELAAIAEKLEITRHERDLRVTGVLPAAALAEWLSVGR